MPESQTKELTRIPALSGFQSLPPSWTLGSLPMHTLVRHCLALWNAGEIEKASTQFTRLRAAKVSFMIAERSTGLHSAKKLWYEARKRWRQPKNLIPITSQILTSRIQVLYSNTLVLGFRVLNNNGRFKFQCSSLGWKTWALLCI